MVSSDKIKDKLEAKRNGLDPSEVEVKTNKEPVKKPREGIFLWWDNRSSKGKAASLCCLGAFLFLIIVGILSPEMTNLNLESYAIQIDDKTTECIIKGNAEPNATVNITAADLNITDIKVNVGRDGKFEYKLKIPIEITDTKVTVKAQNKDKLNNSKEVTIQRPLTPLTVNQIPQLNNNTQNITIEGDSDPQAVITINSKELNIKNITIKPDAKGHYKYTIPVPLNIKSASISITAISKGKRSTTKSTNITRIISQPTPAPSNTPTPKSTTETENTESTSTSSDSSMSPNAKGYETGYIDGWYGYSYKSYSGDFGEGYKTGYQLGSQDATNGLTPEWQIYGYKKWPPE